MSHLHNLGVIHIKEINLWAHVGVLPKERQLGQKFLLDVSLWMDLDQAAKNDDLSLTADYSFAINGLQKMALETNCMTLETFSEMILNFIEDLYGKIPVKVLLRKCHPPINGFNGVVAIERNRHFPS
tara:strand:+ start:3842 stop:4222 length:381 start_codon:yes stop_codon:yes gene_type:complete